MITKPSAPIKPHEPKQPEETLKQEYRIDVIYDESTRTLPEFNKFIRDEANRQVSALHDVKSIDYDNITIQLETVSVGDSWTSDTRTSMSLFVPYEQENVNYKSDLYKYNKAVEKYPTKLAEYEKKYASYLVQLKQWESEETEREKAAAVKKANKLEKELAAVKKKLSVLT